MVEVPALSNRRGSTISFHTGWRVSTECFSPVEMKPSFRYASLWCFLLLLCSDADAQVCRLSVAGVNRERRVMGSIAAECPNPLHSAPFGNWGVASNFGPKLNGHQFQGWCHDMRVCDNAGQCLSNCSDGWYEWNSCTTNPLFQAPNCSLYNAADCTEQISTMGINVLGTQAVDVPVTCPLDSDRDGVLLDSGGCRDLRTYSRGNNFMSMYELDPLATDELVQTIYYPDIVVPWPARSCGAPPQEANGQDLLATTARRHLRKYLPRWPWS